MKRRLDPGRLVELFAAGNLGFLAVDVWLAHAANAFAHRAEWIPVVFSCLAPLPLAPAVWRGPRVAPGRQAGYVVGVLAIFVGLAGMILHLHDSFFVNSTLKSLVYTAPFVAPLAYVGLGLLLLLNRLETPSSLRWSQWVGVLALGGFVGNLGLSLLDHAQNGFFNAVEWVPVAAAALAVGALLAVMALPHDRQLLRFSLWLMAAQAVVGMWGFVAHLVADMADSAVGAADRFVHGAPVFAPLLFADLAALGALGLWRHRVALNALD